MSGDQDGVKPASTTHPNEEEIPPDLSNTRGVYSTVVSDGADPSAEDWDKGSLKLTLRVTTPKDEDGLTIFARDWRNLRSRVAGAKQHQGNMLGAWSAGLLGGSVSGVVGLLSVAATADVPSWVWVMLWSLTIITLVLGIVLAAISSTNARDRRDHLTELLGTMDEVDKYQRPLR